MTERRIVSENPEADIWKALLRFSFPRNIERELLKRFSGGPPSLELVNSISGSMIQAEAYFRAARSAPLDISPLLTYYGGVNLVSASCSLVTGTALAIRSHGAALAFPSPLSRIGEVQITPNQPTTGGIQTFANTYCPGQAVANGFSWNLEEVLGSVPDLKTDFESCYPLSTPHVIPVEIVKLRRKHFERIRKEDIASFGTSFDWTRIRDFTKNYLPPQDVSDFLILNRKLGYSNCGVCSISGRKYLEVLHIKGAASLAPGIVVTSMMGLYALSYLSRYRPEIWTPFVRNDETGERLLVERFISICQRQLPNLVLNKMSGCDINYVFEIDGISDLTGTYTEADLQELVDKRVEELARIKGVRL